MSNVQEKIEAVLSSIETNFNRLKTAGLPEANASSMAADLANLLLRSLEEVPAVKSMAAKLEKLQEPSIGRMVRVFIPATDGTSEECAAIIAKVFDGDAEAINAAVVCDNGNVSGFTSVPRTSKVPAGFSGVTWEFPLIGLAVAASPAQAAPAAPVVETAPAPVAETASDSAPAAEQTAAS